MIFYMIIMLTGYIIFCSLILPKLVLETNTILYLFHGSFGLSVFLCFLTWYMDPG